MSCVYAEQQFAEPRTDLTDTVYRGFVRQDEEWPVDSQQYQAGNGIENRKKPPPEEIPGDVFDRQRVIPGFDQGLIEREVCLVLGAGGIGQDVALTLGRLGVQKIILVDNDVFEATNLTRQCLGSKTDVGERKVEVAARGLQSFHSLRSEVEAVHCDAIADWPRIVELAQQATAVFNGIDAGAMWDFCINSLCKELGLPLCAGQSFGWKFMTELYTGRAKDVCAFCYDSTKSLFGADERAIVKKGGIYDRFLEFLTSRGFESKSDVGAEVLVAFLREDLQFRCFGSQLEEVVQLCFERLGCSVLQRFALQADLLKIFVEYEKQAVSKILPGTISGLRDLGFIPRPKHAETRYIGSWVCPCLGCAVTMVSQWTALLTAPIEDMQDSAVHSKLRNLPQAVTFNLDASMTAEEQMGYEFGALGCSVDKADRRHCRDPSSKDCRVCAAATRLHREEDLFFGRIPVVLSPVPGEVQELPHSWKAPEINDCKRQVALRRRGPLSSGVGESHTNVVVPALPALDWEREGASPASESASRWPMELKCMPLMKVQRSSLAALAPSSLCGVASGIRSALVRSQGKWWRLKGCGNRDEGFPLEAKGDRGELNIRGCCFRHTADTELRMTALAVEALNAANLDCANKAVGSYRYTSDPEWPLPQLERFCAVFETLGNARLGDHLLAGLLKLLPHLVPLPKHGFSALRTAIAVGRGAEPGKELFATADLVCCGMATADVAGQLSLAKVSLEEVVPPTASSETGVTLAIPIDLQEIWDGARERLVANWDAPCAAGEASLLLWLAWRLGWECGATLRALHASGISWGTYPDAMGIHCNAHVNNLVVKPPRAGRSNTFLAALDFDMAFTREVFVPEACKSHSNMGLDSFDGVLAFEVAMGMQTVLSGSDFTSTGVSNSVQVPESHKALEIAMRDTLVTACDAAYIGGEDSHPLRSSAMQAVAHDLIRIALCLTSDVEA
eukprot:TRINITY_DN88510_c0_g1_i1.p1 TRINITY_DN88510_c0_g1~~TRINITY_DN88510_c0_g1_i1.p1  ORF type:complete len:962 (+),score=135.46 TRINITY_DN88510_c0_g1_i1:366-3251(+)